MYRSVTQVCHVFLGKVFLQLFIYRITRTLFRFFQLSGGTGMYNDRVEDNKGHIEYKRNINPAESVQLINTCGIDEKLSLYIR